MQGIKSFFPQRGKTTLIVAIIVIVVIVHLVMLGTILTYKMATHEHHDDHHDHHDDHDELWDDALETRSGREYNFAVAAGAK